MSFAVLCASLLSFDTLRRPTHSSRPHPGSLCSAATMAKQRNEMLPGGIERYSRSAIYKKKGAFKKLGKVCSGPCHRVHTFLIAWQSILAQSACLIRPSACVCVCVLNCEHLSAMFIPVIPTMFMLSRCMRTTLDRIWPRLRVHLRFCHSPSVEPTCHTTHSPRLPRSLRQVAPRRSRLTERRTARREPSL